ncbi:hypothetical protein RF11_06579 [Thelohanellus kitauei]|uniref:Secreted protein n=1 Tax=Thelohanellus kitauei TaxID=669202 RepID=A0A0C2N576_THEKT|nr:hypothetical protein RF11_06579 [Thelohanellus kitauei]
MAMIFAVIGIGFILNVQCEEVDSGIIIPNKAGTYPITIGNTRYRGWEPPNEQDFDDLRAILKRDPDHNYLIRGKLKRATSGVDENGLFKIYEVENPDLTYSYPIQYFALNAGTHIDGDKLAKVLDTKPFEILKKPRN